MSNQQDRQPFLDAIINARSVIAFTVPHEGDPTAWDFGDKEDFAAIHRAMRNLVERWDQKHPEHREK